MNQVDLELLKEIADLESVPQGAFNLRKDGELDSRNSTANIEIVTKTDGNPGIDIHIKPGTKKESLHIPVILTKSGLKDLVYNDFHIGVFAIFIQPIKKPRVCLVHFGISSVARTALQKHIFNTGDARFRN